MNSFLVLFVVFGVALAHPVSKCSDGSASIPTIAGMCPSSLTLVNNAYCCPEVKYTSLRANGTHDLQLQVDFITNPSMSLGPAIQGLCPGGYAVVYTTDYPTGECVDIQGKK